MTTSPIGRWWGNLFVRAGTVALASSLLFVFSFPYRTDYVGHYLAGFAGTLLLLSGLVAVGPPRVDMPALVIGLVAIGMGWATESTIFKLAIFDPVDFVNQSLGAMIAVLVVLGEKPRVRTGLGLSAFAFLLLIVAFSLAFA